MKVRRQLPTDFVQVDLLHSFQESLVIVKVELYLGLISASVQPTLLFISRLAIYRYLSGINILSLKHRHEIITSLPLQYTWDSLLIKDVKRLFIQYKYQICSTLSEYQVYWEVLYLEFYLVFSDQFINNEILLCKQL